MPHPALHLNNYAFLFTDPLYVSAYLYSLKVAAVSTLFCLLLGYPMAYVIARAAGTWRSVLLMLIMLPFWTSSCCASMPGSGCSNTMASSTISCCPWA